MFRTDLWHPLNWNGLAYSTEALPHVVDESKDRDFHEVFFEPVGGNWYRVLRL
jgi:hypothetical protein